MIVNGIVELNMLYAEKERVILLKISEEEAKKFNFDENLNNPLKTGVEEKKGHLYFKAHTQFDITVYNKDNILIDDIDINDIGKGSAVSISVIIKEGKYKDKKYISAYLKSIKIHDLQEPVPYCPFE